MNAEEKQVIVQEVIEMILNKMPEVIGNLMMHHSMINDFRSKFKQNYPDLIGHEKVVAKVIEQIEGQSLTMSADELLKKAVPIIREQIKTTNSLNTTSLGSKPNLPLTLSNDVNGVL